MQVILFGNKVRIDKQGRYSLNDLHQAAISAGTATDSQRPSLFMRSGQIKRFVEALSEAQKSASANVIKGGLNQGVWGAELLAIRYAAWIDPGFEVQVYELFSRAKESKALTDKTRSEARLEYRPMTDAIKAERELAGKEIKPHHFSNEADLINRVALGMTAAKFRAHHDLDKKANLRDYLTPEQMRCVMELQRANTVFISMGWDFQRRKDELSAVFKRNHAERLIAELHMIEA